MDQVLYVSRQSRNKKVNDEWEIFSDELTIHEKIKIMKKYKEQEENKNE